MTDDREHLKTLLTALDASPRALRREPLDARNKDQDQVTDYAIIGRHGHVYPDGRGWLICITEASSSARWTNIKRRLSFCRLTQDGDDEGCFHLDRLPTPTEADAIRRAIHVKRKRHMSAAQMAVSRLGLERARHRRGLLSDALAQSQI